MVGLYVAYTGLIKRETSKALHAVINFVVVFLLSASFIAYAPDYIKKINEFSSDISTASLDLGTKIMLPNSDSEGKDSVDLIRDSLFSIQVEQPWLLLQFGNSNAEEIGADRVEALVSASPEDEDGKTREEVVKTEIEDNDNNNLTIPQVVNRLGMVFFLLFFNLGITIFVFLLTGMMLFSQILFIIFAMFLPISFLLSMIPSYESMVKQAIVRVFNTIMTRAGITLIVTAVSYTHLGDIFIYTSADEEKGVLLELKGRGCRQFESYLLAQERSWYDFLMDALVDGGVMKRIDLAINDHMGILDIPELAEKCRKREYIGKSRSYKFYLSGELIKHREDDREYMGRTLYLGSLKSDVYFCIYEKDYEQYVKFGIPLEEADIINRFEIRLRNERAYYAEMCIRDSLRVC